MSVIKNFTTMNIENTQECFVQLWRQLERTRRLLGGQYKRYSVRNVLRVWFIRKVSFHALDAAYSIAFPNSTSINVNKKKKSNEERRNQ